MAKTIYWFPGCFEGPAELCDDNFGCHPDGMVEEFGPYTVFENVPDDYYVRSEYYNDQGLFVGEDTLDAAKE